MLTLAATNYWIGGLAIVFILVCVILMLAILIQRPRGGGLSGAFGGSSNAQAVFGSKTGDALTWITVVLFAGFLILAIVLTHLVRPPSDAVANPPAGSPAPANTNTNSPGAPGAAKSPATAVPALPDAAMLPPLEGVKAPAESVKTPATAPAAEGGSEAAR